MFEGLRERFRGSTKVPKETAGIVQEDIVFDHFQEILGPEIPHYMIIHQAYEKYMQALNLNLKVTAQNDGTSTPEMVRTLMDTYLHLVDVSVAVAYTPPSE